MDIYGRLTLQQHSAWVSCHFLLWCAWCARGSTRFTSARGKAWDQEEKERRWRIGSCLGNPRDTMWLDWWLTADWLMSHLHKECDQARFCSAVLWGFQQGHQERWCGHDLFRSGRWPRWPRWPGLPEWFCHLQSALFREAMTHLL